MATSNLFSVLDMCSKCVFLCASDSCVLSKNKAVLYCLSGASTCKNRSQTVTGKITGIKMHLVFVFDMKIMITFLRSHFMSFPPLQFCDQ